jgi:hypothetical protein
VEGEYESVASDWLAGASQLSDPDRTPYDEMGYDSPDLSGRLAAIRFTLPDGTAAVGWEVDGQPADPKTIRPAA